MPERALDPAILEKAAANYQFFIDQGRDLSHINKRWFIAIEAGKNRLESRKQRDRGIVGPPGRLRRAVC